MVVYLSLVLYVCSRHVTLTTGVGGEIRLIAVSSRLANAKPFSLSVVVCVDDVRDWMVCEWPMTSARLGMTVAPRPAGSEAL